MGVIFEDTYVLSYEHHNIQEGYTVSGPYQSLCQHTHDYIFSSNNGFVFSKSLNFIAKNRVFTKVNAA